GIGKARLKLSCEGSQRANFIANSRVHAETERLHASRPRRDAPPRRAPCRRRTWPPEEPPMHAPSTRKTLLALTLAAAFGGFAAIAIRAGLEQPAEAQPTVPTALPAVSALPTTVAGQPLPSLAPMLEKVTP